MARFGRNGIAEIPGGENAADLLSKFLDGPAVSRCMRRLGCIVEGGRHKLAPDVKSGVDDRDKWGPLIATRCPLSTGVEEK